jgi:hypothetical protein
MEGKRPDSQSFGRLGVDEFLESCVSSIQMKVSERKQKYRFDFVRNKPDQSTPGQLYRHWSWE